MIFFQPGIGWRWPDGTIVFQEQQLLPGTPLPIGYSDYGKPIVHSDGKPSLRVESGRDGFWVMDRLGSLHKFPFQTAEAAEAYLTELNNSII